MSHSTNVESPKIAEVPKGNLAGFVKYFQQDLLSGFLVFLIALPLCLGISIASGYPPIAGIFTAIIGAVVATFLSNCELTIKGPAAGLIVIVLGCIEAFGGDGMIGEWSAADTAAYKAALAVTVVAAVLQILFGVFRAGILGEFFPVSAVHGMLAAIGVIIIAKQIPTALGVTASGEPLELLKKIPEFIQQANPAIASIGLVSVVIVFLWPIVKKSIPYANPIPAPLVVLLVAIPMGMYFDLLNTHEYSAFGKNYSLGPKFLVRMPDRVFGMFSEITSPNFAALKEPKAWLWVFMFFIIGSLESLLSAKAVDLLDPWKRKSNMNRDLVAVGVGNLAAGMLGGLPMISEIVRSRANIDNGAKTRFANFWHGMFLLSCVALIPMFLHRIPTAALAAMLIYTGTRLAHPREFMNMFRVGREQLAIFAITMIAVLATDLLIGICVGIVVKAIIHVSNGVSLMSLVKPDLTVVEDDGHTVKFEAYKSAVFSNWIPIRRKIERLGLVERKNVVIDFSNTKLVDHSVMVKLDELASDFEEKGLGFTVLGLEAHQPLANHAHAARKKGLATLKRLTIVADPNIERLLEADLIKLGATGYTSIPCSGIGKRQIDSGILEPVKQVRIEIIAPSSACEKMMEYLRTEIQPSHHITVAAEAVQVARVDAFVSGKHEKQVAPLVH